MSLKDQLENAAPGAVVRFSGTVTGIGKLTGLKGTKEQPIILEGADPSACIGSSGAKDVGNLRLEGCSFVVVRNLTLRDATMDQARAFQAFGCDNLLLEDLTSGPNIRFDHFHLVGSHDCTGRRCHGDGTGMQPLVGGVKGGHFIYVAEGCQNIVWEDCEAKNMMAAPLQCNAESGPVENTTFRRIRLRDWQNGAAVNLQAASGVVIEDLDAETHSPSAHDGVLAWGGARGVTIARYRIVVPHGMTLSGVSRGTTGQPQPPRFGLVAAPVPPGVATPPVVVAPPEPPPPYGQYMAALQRQLAGATAERDAAIGARDALASRLAQIHQLAAP